MGTLRSFLCRRVFTPYIGLIMGVLILIYKHNAPIQHMLDGTMLDVVIFPVMYTHSDIGWVIILMSAISLIAKQRDWKARKDQDKLLLGIELLLLLTAFVLSFFGASRIRYYLWFVIIVWCVFFVLYWRHIKFLVDEGKKDYYDELVDLLTVEEREEANKKEHEEKTNKIKEKENKHKEKPIKREPVIERVVQDPPEYVAKMLKMSNIFAWIAICCFALFMGLFFWGVGSEASMVVWVCVPVCFTVSLFYLLKYKGRSWWAILLTLFWPLGVLVILLMKNNNKPAGEIKTKSFYAKEPIYKEEPEIPFLRKNTLIWGMRWFCNRWLFNRFLALFIGVAQLSQGIQIRDNLQTDAGLCFVLLAIVMILWRSRKGVVSKPIHWVSLSLEFLMILGASFLMVTRGFYDPVPYIFSGGIFWVNYWSVIKKLINWQEE